MQSINKYRKVHDDIKNKVKQVKIFRTFVFKHVTNIKDEFSRFHSFNP